MKSLSGFSAFCSFQGDFLVNPMFENYGLAPPKRALRKSDGARNFQTEGRMSSGNKGGSKNCFRTKIREGSEIKAQGKIREGSKNCFRYAGYAECSMSLEVAR